MLKFSEIVKVEKTSCIRCMTFMYTLPCQVDKNIVNYLEAFGKPIYPIKTVMLIRIDSKDGYKIDSKIGKNAIKFAMPKELTGVSDDKTRKGEFEKELIEWLSETLNIPVTNQ